MMAGPAMVILLPVEATGPNKNLDSSDPNYTTGMGVITMANIAPVCIIYYMYV